MKREQRKNEKGTSIEKCKGAGNIGGENVKGARTPPNLASDL